MNKTVMATPNIKKKPSSLRYFQEGVAPVDIGSWRLNVQGIVDRPLELSLDDLLSMPQVYSHRRSMCVCLWSIKRHWEGVLLKDVLELANVDVLDDSLYLKQRSIGTDKGVYDSTIHLASAVRRNAILAHSVDGSSLPLENGFPLRLHDFGLYLYKCVKALASLEVTRENEIGYWEEYAGYDVDGTVLPKRYYAVDLHRKFYFAGKGEVMDEDIC